MSGARGERLTPGPQRQLSHVIEGNEGTHTFQGVLNSLHAKNLYLDASVPEGRSLYTHRAVYRKVEYTVVGWLLHLRREGLGVVGGETISRPSMLKDKNVIVIT